MTAFLAAGARVTNLDLAPSPKPSDPSYQYFVCDIASEKALVDAFSAASATFGPVACCVALASLDLSVLPHHESLVDMDVEQWRRTQRVNVEGTFLTARMWLRQLRGYSPAEKKEELRNVGLIVVGSESGHFGERGNADYASGKSAVQFGLVRSLAGDANRVWEGAR